jgi:hypothetical protein
VTRIELEKLRHSKKDNIMRLVASVVFFIRDGQHLLAGRFGGVLHS